MAFNQVLADRVRELLVHLPLVEEKYMFGGVCFMVQDKMCVGVVKDELMCRIDPELEPTALENNAVRPMDFTGKSMKGFVFVDETRLKTKKDLSYWVGLCLDFNPSAKATKKKIKKIKLKNPK